VWIGYDMPRTIIANGYAGELAVPLWGRFMAAATRHDKPDRFTMPATVVPVTICRLSGKLPTDACESAVMFDRDGNPTDRSMLYTEYFVRGTEPTAYCPLHSSFNVIATSGDPSFGSGAVATSGTAPQVPPSTPKAGASVGESASPAAVPTASVPDPSDSQPRKRGFWGRIFRR
jgi:penicillin-binding protein 1A